MDDLAKADVKTLRTFIDNHITADRLLEDVLPRKREQKNPSAKKSPKREKKTEDHKDQKKPDYIRLIND